MGDGIILDPFMGGGSTVAAAIAVGYRSIGVEADAAFFDLSQKAIPNLAALSVSRTTRVIKTSHRVSLNGRGKSQLGFFR